MELGPLKDDYAMPKDKYAMPTTKPVEIYRTETSKKFMKYPAFTLIWVLWLIMIIGAIAMADLTVIVAVLIVDTITAVIVHSALSWIIDIREYLMQMSTQIEKRAN